jgi:hypothetical protein
MLEGKWIEFDKKAIPTYVKLHGSSADKPDLLIDPKRY